MDLKRLSDKAKQLVDKRGGSDSVKEDADELKDIAQGPGSFADKAKAAVDAIKEPGAVDRASAPAEAASEPERDRAEAKVEGEERGKHAGAGHKRQGGQGRGGGGKGRAKARGEGRGGAGDAV